MEVVVGGDGDEGVEVFVWELVLEGEGSSKVVVVEEGFGEVGCEGREGGGGLVG